MRQGGQGGPGGEDLAASLLTVNLRQHSRDLMIAGRPGNKMKFSGKPHQDFESIMATFDRVANQPGITDEMRCLELRHWLEGSPLIILTQYDKINDGSVAYQKIRSHLDRTYGRKVFTAREMLEELLSGAKLKDPIEIEEFILRMEKTYVDAVATHRDATFSTNDTFNEILRKNSPLSMVINGPKTRQRPITNTWPIDQNHTVLPSHSLLSSVEA